MTWQLMTLNSDNMGAIKLKQAPAPILLASIFYTVKSMQLVLAET